MKIFNTVLLCIVAILLSASSVFAIEPPRLDKVGRFQIVSTNNSDVFLVDTLMGSTWILQQREEGNTKDVYWVSVSFGADAALPGESKISVRKKRESESITLLPKRPLRK